MKELLQATPRWKELEYRPVMIETNLHEKPYRCWNYQAKSIGDEHLMLFQVKVVYNRLKFLFHSGCIINDGDVQYICMQIFVPDYPHHPFVLAKPRRNCNWNFPKYNGWGPNPFHRYGGWFWLPKNPVKITTLTTRKRPTLPPDFKARSYDLDCFRLFQFDETMWTFQKYRIGIAPGCTITDSTGSYRCLMIMLPEKPQFPMLITEPCSQVI